MGNTIEKRKLNTLGVSIGLDTTTAYSTPFVNEGLSTIRLNQVHAILHWSRGTNFTLTIRQYMPIYMTPQNPEKKAKDNEVLKMCSLIIYSG